MIASIQLGDTLKPILQQTAAVLRLAWSHVNQIGLYTRPWQHAVLDKLRP